MITNQTERLNFASTKNIPQYNKLNAIQYAAQQGYDQFITALPSLSNEELNKANTEGMTPLHVCASNGYAHTLHSLLIKGANPREPNKELQRPIHSALFVPLLHDKELVSNKITIFKFIKIFNHHMYFKEFFKN